MLFFQKVFRGLSFFCFLNLLSSFAANSLFPQQPNRDGSRQLVIGDLVGKTDIRDLKILTKQGLFSITGNGNGKPFKIISRTPKQIVLQLFQPTFARRNHPDQIVYEFFESERSLISALILDEVDYAILENEPSALEVQRSNKRVLPLPLRMKSNTVKLICYNYRNPILKSRNVRISLAFAINHGYIIKKILADKASIARGPFDDDSPLFNSNMESYKYNPRKAIQLLNAVGWRDRDGDGILDKAGKPFVLTLYYQKGLRLDEEISRRIKINLLRVGVHVKPIPLTKIMMNDRLSSSDFEAVLMDYTFEDNVESIADFFSENGSKNYMGYRNRTFENYLKFYYADEDAGKRKTLIKSMQRVVNVDQPVTFLYFKWLTHHMVNTERFDNYRYTVDEKRGEIRPFEEWVIKNF